MSNDSEMLNDQRRANAKEAGFHYGIRSTMPGASERGDCGLACPDAARHWSGGQRQLYQEMPESKFTNFMFALRPDFAEGYYEGQAVARDVEYEVKRISSGLAYALKAARKAGGLLRAPGKSGVFAVDSPINVRLVQMSRHQTDIADDDFGRDVERMYRFLNFYFEEIGESVGFDDHHLDCAETPDEARNDSDSWRLHLDKGRQGISG